MIFDATVLQMLKTGIWESLFMTFSSSFFAYLIGIPLGIILVVMDKDGIYPIPWLQRILGLIINLLRSVPFIILLIMVIPITRAIVGTTLGAKAVIPPLVIASAPYVARVVEASFKEVDPGVIEAAKSMGSSTFQIIWKVLLPEAKPSLLVGAALSITTILAYSAMAGFVGGGGLGDIAIKYGYYRYQTEMMFITVAILVIIVQVIQEAGMKLSRVSDKRIK
ncbi:methionine ABC transporter permease [Lacrimispora saccharolytica]|uniref:Binding-protein-dependent transport systems inner membrane component n=1 Tax=Lacrimispora saccharolytica (strain ATCC 35040 / DSM 2544 / NRCC 2533 / WM1) TaxID=610130 RepID=D9R3G3_LACSW|nr:methionine ABC transporter permease [Lacrimispora saccharolytica]ADL04912.1 binding-protein-dependent transport systems inner membrane component [[Clostridium] saccharolyticum WM1]QRV20881.1 ABC transporter permease [Lacrimispora saccharolytica]